MWKKTLEWLKKSKAVYLHAIWGAAAYYAKSVKKVIDVDYLDDFWIPEALWQIEVKDFLAIVSMDNHWESLHNKST